MRGGLTPIARLVLEPAVIAVKADALYKTLAEFVEAANTSPMPSAAAARTCSSTQQDPAPPPVKLERFRG